MTERRTQANRPSRLRSRVQDQLYNHLGRRYQTGNHTVDSGGLGAYYLANDLPRHPTWPYHCHSSSSPQEKAVASPNPVRQMRKDRLWMILILRSWMTWCSLASTETSSKNTLTLSKTILRNKVKVPANFLCLAPRLRLMSLLDLFLNDGSKLLRPRLHLPQLRL